MERKISPKAWRVNLGMTQQDVADRLGVSKPTVIRWENEEKPLPTLAAYALAKLYGIEVDDLF